jgi:glutathione S-transferase
MTLTLIIGNKNYSSWSLRPWLGMKQFDLSFDEIRIPLYTPDATEKILSFCPEGNGDRVARAVARSICAEMHSGFSALRFNMGMNCRASYPGRGMTPEVQQDIGRITTIWRNCRKTYGADGEFLFGRFTIADAFYAPVVLRFRTYNVWLDQVCQAYADTILALPAMQDWVQASQDELESIVQYEY